MSRKAFNIVLTVITLVSLLAAFALTSTSVQISRNKATNQAKEEVLGTWTDTLNPQMIIQFTSENEYKEMGQVMATFTINPEDSTIVLTFLPDYGSEVRRYNYAFNSNHSQLTLTNLDTGESILYSR